MKYKVGDLIRIRDNYIMLNGSLAFEGSAESRIDRLDNRTATIVNCYRSCSYDPHEPGYRFREIPNLVFKESMIKESIIEGIEDRFEILDL